MDEVIGNFVKFLSSSVVVRIHSNPSFAIEIFLALVVCVVQCLLIFDVNTLARRTNAKAAAKLRIRHPIKESSSTFHSLLTLQATQVFQKKPSAFGRAPVYAPVNARLHTRFSRSNIGWMLGKGDSILRHKFTDRVEHLLSISPSEYVRRDKERKSREQGLRSCIQSLTSLLEKALNNETLEVPHMSKEDIRKSINALRDTFENQVTNEYELSDFPSPSLQSMIETASNKRLLHNSLNPELLSPIYHASNLCFKRSSFDVNPKRCKSDDERSQKSKLSIRSSESLSELFRKQSNELRQLMQ